MAVGRQHLVDDVTSVVTELVANAVLHARTSLELTVRPQGEGVRVEVSDGSPVVPRSTAADLSATSGRGLMMVDSMSTAWGVEPRGAGKTVWAVVDGSAG